jgi:hypothetical protein
MHLGFFPSEGKMANLGDESLPLTGVIMKKVAMRFGFMLVLTAAASLLFFACASAPKEEIAATQAAIQAAQTDDVQTYAEESLKDATDTMKKATAEVQVQDEKFALSRDYQAASDLLKQAKEKAAKALTDAQANKLKAKADAEVLIASLATMIGDAKKALATAPRGKDTKAELEALQADFKTAEEAVAAATQSMTGEKFKDALAQANTAKDKANGIIEQVNAAKEKLRGRK